MDLAYQHRTEELGLAPFDAYAYGSARVSLRFGEPASAIVVAVVPDIEPQGVARRPGEGPVALCRTRRDPH